MMDDENAKKDLGYDGFFPLSMTTFTISVEKAKPLIEAGKIRVVSGYNEKVVCVWNTAKKRRND